MGRASGRTTRRADIAFVGGDRRKKLFRPVTDGARKQTPAQYKRSQSAELPEDYTLTVAYWDLRILRSFPHLAGKFPDGDLAAMDMRQRARLIKFILTEREIDRRALKEQLAEALAGQSIL